MLENTMLNDKIIKELLMSEYNISIKESHYIDRGTANIYILDNKYVLKEISYDRGVSSIDLECDVLEYLSNNDIKVPSYLKTINGSNHIEYKDKIIIV